MSYDYRAERDRIFGVVRRQDGKIDFEPNGLTMVERLLLVALVEFAPNIEPSVASLVKMTGMCERSVRNTLRSLEQKGAIKTTSRHGGRSRYELQAFEANPGKTCPPPRQDVPPCDSLTPRQEMPHTPARDAGPPRQEMPPKQTSKADKKAEKTLSAVPTLSVPPLTLTPLEPEKPKEPTPHQTVVARWCTRYEQANGERPILSEVDGRNVKRLLKAVNAAKACELIDNAFSNEWFRANGTIGYLASNPSRYQQPPKVGAASKCGPTQPGINDRIEYEDALNEPAKPPAEVIRQMRGSVAR